MYATEFVKENFTFHFYKKDKIKILKWPVYCKKIFLFSNRKLKLTSILIKQTPRASKIFPQSLSSFFPSATLIDPVSFMTKYSAQDPEIFFHYNILLEH